MGKKEEVLRLENIEYSYDGKKTVLDNVSISFHKGEKVAILGQNGSGKSTLFLCSNMINTIFSGKIYLSGIEVGKSKKELNELRRKVGIVFQNPNDQIIASNVYEEISFGPMNLSLTVDSVRERVENGIKMMNLDNYRDRMTQYLSGGEQKRVTIADILAMYPEIMLFDEPMASLDMKNARELEEVLNTLSENGIGIVVATHDVNFAWRWADRIVVIDEGKIIGDSNPESIFENRKIIKKAELDVPMLYTIGKKLNIVPIPKSVDDIEIEV